MIRLLPSLAKSRSFQLLRWFPASVDLVERSDSVSFLFDEVPQFPAASGVSSLRRSRGFKWISDSPSLILALRPRLGPFVPVIGVSGVRLRGGVTRHT